MYSSCGRLQAEKPPWATFMIIASPVLLSKLFAQMWSPSDGAFTIQSQDQGRVVQWGNSFKAYNTVHMAAIQALMIPYSVIMIKTWRSLCVCKCACVCVHMYVCMCARACVCVCVRACTCMQAIMKSCETTLY